MALVLLLSLSVSLSPTLGGCASSHLRGPRTLATVGLAMALGGSGLWVVGARQSDLGHVPAIGLGVVAAGIATIIAAGGWIAAKVACQADPDCEESEECREIPAPPGGIPYKQCMPR